MTYLTHALAFIAGISAALWFAAYVPDSISKILNHSPKD